MDKPFSQACENNKQPIFQVISNYFKAGDQILEVGSGTAQHAIYFCHLLPEINWIPCEITENMNTLAAGMSGDKPANLMPAEMLDVTQQEWPFRDLDGLFSSNCLHIMPESFNADFFRGAGKVLKVDATLCVYGPFKYQGEFTSDSNARFDSWLKDRDPLSGIRDFEKIDQLAKDNDFELIEDRDMPANNQCLIWRKQLAGKKS
jgi:SAM-dependent methyltransferase